MGRKAGHLALGIGKAAGATLTLIPEEFPAADPRCKTIVDTLAGAIIKRLSYGRRDGVAVIAEGVVLSIDPSDLAGLDDVERDAHGHVRIAEVEHRRDPEGAGQRAAQASSGIKTTIVAKNIGYELRCADPIPFDMEYTRDLGYCAAKYLLAGGNARDDLDAGRPLRADPVRADDRPRDRPHARAPGRHPLDALRDRAPLHDPAAARRLRGSARARASFAATRRHARSRQFRERVRVSRASEPPPLAMDAKGEA